MASPLEFTSQMPEVFQRPDLDSLVYIETRRVPNEQNPLSGNVGISPMILGEENYRRTGSPLEYGAWRAREQARAEDRLRTLKERSGLEAIASPRLPHGTDLIDIDTHLADTSLDIPFEKRASGDASITTEPGVGTMVGVGDCIPLTMVFPGAEVIVQEHVGIRGAAKEIIPKVSRELVRRGLDMRDASVYLGPHANYFQMNRAEFEELNDIVSRGSDELKQEYLLHTQIGPNGYPILGQTDMAVRQLERSGVLPGEIQVSPLSTLGNKHLFSNYVTVTTGAPDGRFGALVGKTRHPRS